MLGFTIATLINRSIVIIYRYNLFHTEITTKRIIFEITYILFVNIFILIFSKLFRIRNSPDQVYYEDILDQDAE